MNRSTTLVCLRIVFRLYFFSNVGAELPIQSLQHLPERRALLLGILQGREVVIDLVAGDQYFACEHLWHRLPPVTHLTRDAPVRRLSIIPRWGDDDCVEKKGVPRHRTHIMSSTSCAATGRPGTLPIVEWRPGRCGDAGRAAAHYHSHVTPHTPSRTLDTSLTRPSRAAATLKVRPGRCKGLPPARRSTRNGAPLREGSGGSPRIPRSFLMDTSRGQRCGPHHRQDSGKTPAYCHSKTR